MNKNELLENQVIYEPARRIFTISAHNDLTFRDTFSIGRPKIIADP